MKTVKDKDFDLAIVDPPYGMMGNGFSPTAKKRSIKGIGHLSQSNMKFKKVDKKYPGGFQTKLGGRPTKEYWDELFRVSKNVMVFGMQYFLPYLPIHNCVVVWDKMNGESRFSDAEIIYTTFDSGTRIIRQTTDRSDRIHPTQKPIKLYLKILRKFGNPGMKILDTHLGSGSSAIAAEEFGAHFVGCEIDTQYFSDAKKRIAANTAQLLLYPPSLQLKENTMKTNISNSLEIWK